MNKKILVAITVILLIVVGIGTYFILQKPVILEPKGDVPYYFIAIHNEPLPDLRRTDMPTLEESYMTLKRIIAKADEYNIKLTLMFTAQWADYIALSSERQADLVSWKKAGHEIAAHHHAASHALWDGYTDFSEAKVREIRLSMGRNESYRGTMTDFMNTLKSINPVINSGCVNNEAGDAKEIIYGTCSGYANFGTVGTKGSDPNPEKGVNEYILTITANGITRKYLSHSQVTNEKREIEAEQIFNSMNPGAYGAVAHSIEHNAATGDLEEAQTIIDFMSFIHEKDPSGANSRTVSEVIEQKLLPEKQFQIR